MAGCLSSRGLAPRPGSGQRTCCCWIKTATQSRAASSVSTEPLSKLPRHQATESRSRCVIVYVCLRSCGVDALLLTRGQFREAFCDVGSFVDTKAVSSLSSSSPGAQAGAKGRHIPKSHLGITALDTLAHRRNLAAPAFLALPLDHVRASLLPTQLLPVLTTVCTHWWCCSLIASPMQPSSWLETARMPMQGAGLMSGWTAVMQCPSNACTVSPSTTMPPLLTHLLWGTPSAVCTPPGMGGGRCETKPSSCTGPSLEPPPPSLLTQAVGLLVWYSTGYYRSAPPQPVQC